MEEKHSQNTILSLSIARWRAPATEHSIRRSIPRWKLSHCSRLTKMPELQRQCAG